LDQDATLVDAYRRDGFVNGGELLDLATVEHLRSELTRVIAEQDRRDRPQPYRTMDIGVPGASVWQIVNIWQASAAFAALLRLPRLGALAARLAGAKRLALWHDQVQYKPAGEGGVNWWHQDWPYWRAVTPADELITAWIALDDADEDNGCMTMVPGSHRLGDTIGDLQALGDGRTDHHAASFAAALPRRFRDLEVRPHVCRVAAGHVHFHHANTWHGSHANRSGRPRRAIALHMMSERTTHDANAKHLMSPEIQVPHGAAISGPHFPMVYVEVASRACP